MKYFFTFLMFFYISFSFAQLTEKGNEFIVKMIEKNNIEELVRANKEFKFIKKISSYDDYFDNSSQWGFSKLKKFALNIGYKNNNYYIITEKNDNNSVVYSYDYFGDYSLRVYNDNIVIATETNTDKNTEELILINKKKYIDRIQEHINLINLRLETFNNKNNLENSFLIGDIYRALDQNLDISSKEFFFKRNNSIDFNVEIELTRLGFKFLKRKVEWSDVNDWWYLYDESVFEIAKLENKKREEEEKERQDLDYKKNNPTGIVKDYKKNGYNYTGSLVNGIYEGQGRLSKYDFVNNDETKKRIWTEYSYEGTFKNGEFDGQGKESIRKGVTSYSGNYNRINYEFKFDGNFKNGKYEGFGKLSVASWDINNYKYEGEFKNGIYDGKGKIEYDYDRSKSKYRTISYDGNWKNGTYNGKGELYVFDKNNSNNLNAFTKYNGLFVDGKKEGNFSVKGDFVKYVDSNYSFSYDCLYKNDVEISRKVNFDDGDKFIKLYNEQIEAQRAAERAEKQQKCNNCIIDWKKSTTPKDEYSLWIKIGRKSGEIVMLNGDIYKFDFENGKCKVINGWLVSDNYYPTFDNMIENIIEKCTEKYCR